MKKILLISVLASGFVSFTGCAPMVSGAMNLSVTDAVVVEKTSKYFGAQQKDLIVTNIEKGALATSYQTRYAGKLYNCSIYYGEVICKQPGA